MRTFIAILVIAALGGFAFYKFAYHKLFAPKAPESREEKKNHTNSELQNDKNKAYKKSNVIDKSNDLVSKGKFKEAIDLLQSEVAKRKNEKSDEMRRMLTLLADCFLKNNQQEEAEKVIITINQTYPTSTTFVSMTLNIAAKQTDKTKRLLLLESLVGCRDVGNEALKMANERLENDDKILAWEFFSLAIKSEQIDKNKLSQIKDKCKEFAKEMLFSPLPNKLGEIYEVKKGDSLSTIAKKFNTTVELIQKINGMGSSTNIRPGNRLKVLNGNFKLVVDKSDFSLTVYYDGKYVKEYLVGIGRPEDETPIIPSTRIKSKIKDPVWTKTNPPMPNADPRNPLGSRWMGFEAPNESYGIHGIKPHLENTIGKKESDGCIRLVNKDVEEIFDFVVSSEVVGYENATEVTVKE